MATQSQNGEPGIDTSTTAMNLPNTTKDSSKSGLTHSLTIKLDEKNFLLWSQQVNGVITTHNLHRFVVNPEIPLQFVTVADRLDGKTSDEYQKWLFKDQTLFTWLLSTISDSVLPRVVHCKHAHEGLLMLQEAQFEKFRQELTNPSVSANVAQIESRQNQYNQEAEDQESSTEQYNSNSYRGRGRGKGKARGRGKAPNAPNTGKCHICAKSNHDATNCWYRYEPPSSRANARGYNAGNTSRAPPYNPYPRPSAHLALPQYYHPIPDMDTVSTSSWYPDSGASHHLTFNPNNLAYRMPYQGQDQVTVGNGQGVSIHSLGHSNFCSPYNPNVHLKLNDLLHDTKQTLLEGTVGSDGLYKFQPFEFTPTKNNTLCTQSISSLPLNKLTCPHTSHQNGTVERKHRQIVEMGLTLLSQASMPLKFWDHNLTQAVYLINKLPSSALPSFKSPHHLLFNVCPDYTQLKVFGCLCFPHLRPYNKNKLQLRSSPCIYLGVSLQHKGHKYLDASGKIYVSKDVIFHESNFPYTNLFPTILDTHSTHNNSPTDSPPPYNLNKDKSPTTLTQQTSPLTIQQINSLISQPITSSQTTQTNTTSPLIRPISPSPPSISHQNDHAMITRGKTGNLKPKTFTASIEPTTVKSALADPKWLQAMKIEYKALMDNHTWSLVPVPPHRKAIGCKWIFRVKENPDGSINKYKARLVAKGFLQTPGFDFNETFSPVIKPVTIRLILTLAVTYKWPVQQIDINNAFLNGLLQSKCDPSLLVHHQQGACTYILVYVDDILITGSTPLLIKDLIHKLNVQFALKQLGEVDYFLGIQVHHNTSGGLLLHQSKYIQDLLNKTKMETCKPIGSPMVNNCKLSRYGTHAMQDPSLYRSTVGALQYATLTRPDIAYSVNKVCQFMSHPLESHWKAVKRILRYLKGTISHGLLLHPSPFSPPFSLRAYSDADWATDQDDRRSTSGSCIYFGPNLISWGSKKQQLVARSSTEAEYRSMTNTTAELLWIQSLLQELHVPFHTPTLLCDNLSAVSLAHNPILHSRTKHIELDIHFVREKVLSKHLYVRHVPAVDQLADPLTKPLSPSNYAAIRTKLKLEVSSALMTWQSGWSGFVDSPVPAVMNSWNAKHAWNEAKGGMDNYVTTIAVHWMDVMFII
ncbi:hypothetical protein TSUD_159100 [Trifolium subterraneum]|uniref:Integrase catalytic domain-containing protein n=1 Tax=Trifolium subterraneum TaxID=3900 RepID=A0A2Z6N3M2_TRISU|nr:hypothetical protein TSUD_159100 [Trifolium subterraneum]